MKTTRLLLPVMLAAAFAGCASTPPANDRLESARTTFQQVKGSPAAMSKAPLEVQKAERAFNTAEAAWRKGDDRIEVDHLALLARQQAEVAKTVTERKEVEAGIEDAGRQRDAIRIQSSERDAQAAASRAQTLQAKNATLETSAEQERRRAQALEQKLNDMQAKQTDRGLVVTFSDVLFDVGRADLRSGAMRRVRQLADILSEYPDRNVLIEGFTDATGSDETNQTLSEQRAMSVRTALVSSGIDPRRIVARGLGERFAVASNDTMAGRQQNRRVEAVLSDASGNLPANR